MRKAVGVGLIGLGVVGTGVVRVLAERGDFFTRQVGVPIIVRRAVVRDPSKPRLAPIDPELVTDDAAALLTDPEVDVVVEVMGGEEPAHQYIRRALEAGKHVVTANKELIAKHGPELLALARERGRYLLFEASVGGGIPLIAPLRRDLLANRITSVRAIINGTTNYILTRMAQEGADYADALAEAQRLGYAEPDPTNDVEGYDAAYKLAVLATLAFRSRLAPEQIRTEGITRLSARDFLYAAELGYVIKLVAVAERRDHGLLARVAPVLLHRDEPLAKVDGVYNAVQIVGDLTGMVLFEGRGAGAEPTSSAVIADLLEIADAVVHGIPNRTAWSLEEQLPVLGPDQIESRYYIRVTVSDRPGVLARLAKCLGDNDVSIAAVNQKEANEDQQTAELVIMTHRARESAVLRALAEIAELPVVAEVSTFLRVEE
jgi:homoserine dehydrogenase